MQRNLFGGLLLALCGLVACQRQERTLVDLLHFPDEVRTVVIAPEYAAWYQDAGDIRDNEALADNEALGQKYDEEGDEDRDVEESSEPLDDEYNVEDDAGEEDSLETHVSRE